MIQPTLNVPLTESESKLPRRDFWLLPLIGVLTIFVMLVTSEVVARALWPQQETDPCAVPDASGHSRFRSNCKSRIKSAEGPWVDNFYNECGYHTLESCGRKPSGTIRVAVLGSSFSFGYLTPYDETFTTLAGRALTNRCRRKVEFQNLGVLGVSLNMVDSYRRTDEALALKPDVLLLAITPFDVTKEITPEELARRNQPQMSGQSTPPPVVGNWLRNDVMASVKDSRAVLMLQHFMFQSPVTFSNLYMFYGDNADYLRQPFSSRWQKRFSNLDVVLGDLNRKAQAASVPVMIMLGPSTAQAALSSSPARPGVDPEAFDKEVGTIAAKYSIPVVDPLPDFAGRPDIMSLYFPVDGHFNPKGQHLLADALQKKLLATGYSAFSECARAQ